MRHLAYALIFLLLLVGAIPSAEALSGKINVTNCQFDTFSSCAATVRVSCDVVADTGALNVNDVEITINGQTYSDFTKFSGTNINGEFGFDIIPPVSGNMSITKVLVVDSVGTWCEMSSGAVDSSTCHMNYGARRTVQTNCTRSWRMLAKRTILA